MAEQRQSSSMSSALDIEAEEQPPPQAERGKRPRLHFLDWLRGLMVWCVVFAHIAVIGLPGGINNKPGEPPPQVLVDNRYYTKDDPSSIGVRWVSTLRPVVLPLLFWVSGASVACSFKTRPMGLERIALYTLLGMGCNAILWFIGPQDGSCDPMAASEEKCQKGPILHFAVWPWTSAAGAIIFQMWYCVVLLIFSLVSWPLFGLVKETLHTGFMLVQWGGMVSLYALILYGSDCTQKFQVWGMLSLLEAGFLAASLLTVRGKRPASVPLRSVHYLLAAIAIIQFGATPYQPDPTGPSLIYLCYFFVGFHKLFALGFLMTHTRFNTDPLNEAHPLASTAWPLMFIVLVFLFPSTNWAQPFSLLYAFWHRAIDRLTYVAFTFVVIFALDRTSRDKECIIMPAILQWASLLLYLFHPVFIAILVAAGITQAETVWLGCTALSIVVSQVFIMATRKKEQ